MHPSTILTFLLASASVVLSSPALFGKPAGANNGAGAAGAGAAKAGSGAQPTANSAAVRVLRPSDPPTTTDVQNSITNWQASVGTVNDYLNNPNNNTKLNSAVTFAQDEPVQLGTLMKVKGLSTTGVNAGKVLMGNFPSIVSNLQGVQTGSMSTQMATAAVNFNRCCTVLPAIGQLWTAAATASNAGTMAMPALENQCAQMSCSSGISGANMTASTLASVN